jgi:hypothetical protein
MAKPFIQVGDEIREMTESEHAQYLADQLQLQAQNEFVANVAKVKQSAMAKLAALGLTEAEVSALLGA